MDAVKDERLMWQELQQALHARFGPDGFTTSVFRDNHRLIVAPSQVFAMLKYLKEERGFDLLFELTAVDYLKYPSARDRFGVIYGVANTASGERVFVKTF